MIVTTCLRPNKLLTKQAEEIAADLMSEIVARKEYSLDELYNKWQHSILVVGKNRLEWYENGQAVPYFFHPNSSVFRIRRILKGEHDPFCDASLLTNGDTLLDCTLGMASDSIVASFVVGESGKVVGLEKNPIIAYMTAEGLQTNKQNIADWITITSRIHVEHDDYKNYLSNLKDESFDVVYFDPMFEANIEGSNGISGLKVLAEYDDLSSEIIKQAIRVARKRVVLKDHFRSDRFKKYGFTQLIRKSAEFHFGYIEK